MKTLTEFSCPAPHSGVKQYIDIREIVAIGSLDASLFGQGEPCRWVYLRGGASFALGEQAAAALIELLKAP